MQTLFIKLLATVLAAMFSFLNISVDLPGFSDEEISSTKIEYANEDAGSADAVITV